MWRKLPVVLVVGLAGTIVACSGSEDPQSLCSEPAAASRVEMADFEYLPACVEVRTGATLALQNTGDTPHTFTVADSAVDADVAAGENGSVEVRLSPGTYEVTCTYHPQMKAGMIVA